MSCRTRSPQTVTEFFYLFAAHKLKIKCRLLFQLHIETWFEQFCFCCCFWERVRRHLACEPQTHFRSSLLSLRKIASANPSDKTIFLSPSYLQRPAYGSMPLEPAETRPTIMDKSLGTLLRFRGVFQFTQVQPLPSPQKQCWMCVSLIFSEFQLCIG